MRCWLRDNTCERKFVGAVIVWLALGSMGTVFVYQHHAIDVVNGAAVGFAAVRYIRLR